MAEEVFHGVLDADGDNYISLHEWVTGLHRMRSGLSFEEMHELFDENAVPDDEEGQNAVPDDEEGHFMSHQKFVELLVRAAEVARGGE